MTSPPLQLISFDLCPFVQRAVITLLEKKVPYEVTYINLAKKPAWFLKISPFGKVPVLKVGEEVLFESAVIVEYLDEVYAPFMQPKDPLARAKQRAYTEFANQLFMAQYQLCQADKNLFDHQLESLKELLSRLEPVAQGPFFAGEQPHLVDWNFAPFFHRLLLLEQAGAPQLLTPYPKLAKWANNLLKRPSIQASVPEGFKEKYLNYILNQQGHLAGLISL